MSCKHYGGKIGVCDEMPVVIPGIWSFYRRCPYADGERFEECPKYEEEGEE